MIKQPDDITRLINAYRDGDVAAYDQVVRLLYDDLHGLAHYHLSRAGGKNTLQTTAIVNEVYLKLRQSAPDAVDESHFLAIAATATRHVVIDHARARVAEKRGGGSPHLELDHADGALGAESEALLHIDEALTRLSESLPRLARVFECKFFAGLDDAETAETLAISKRTAQRDWMKARAFLGDLLMQ